MNNKGDFQSLLYIVIMIFVIGFIFIFVNRLNNQFSLTTEGIFNSTAEFQNSSAISAMEKIRTVDNSAWDYAFLAIYIGSIAALCVTAYSTRISAVFFWVYGLLSLGILAVGVMLSNAWQATAENVEMASTVARFPITNFILGSYAPLAVTVIIVIVMILLFGKTPDNNGGAYP